MYHLLKRDLKGNGGKKDKNGSQNYPERHDIGYLHKHGHHILNYLTTLGHVSGIKTHNYGSLATGSPIFY
ncbi:hypothetical protein [Arsenophonus sp.]|uniref:hypothetical protein n=1 Tax=Arsenophonus sp. TaxID=1872640 RepID=UPI002860A899|nr:hypothetical protein [Arsenophonus sp.]MDR5614095.1 hypothetical protein [Arsenophonus sp.]